MGTQPKKTVLITGCSAGGIGHALAREFQARGLHVFATTRSVSKMASLEPLADVTLLPLDVTSAESLAAAVAAVSKETGGTLDYLINNSGQQVTGPVLDVDLGRMRDMYEVNVFGAVAAVQAFAPLVIKAKGTVVNMASIAGLMYPPYMGLYAGTKSALVTISESLRLELAPFDVKVATVIVGVVRTNFFTNTPPTLPPTSLYTAAETQIADRAAGRDVTERQGAPEDFARELVGKVLRGATGRVYVGNLSTVVRVVNAWLPGWVVDYLTVSGTGLDRLS
ncbi:oxidoreductase [Hypoxylon crocopeplum]|nr:oxidoreductase [Hypoxylon crocopeplum]